MNTRLKFRYAIQAASQIDFSCDEHKNFYGEGWLAGWDKAMEVMKPDLKLNEHLEGMKNESKSTRKVIRRRPSES